MNPDVDATQTVVFRIEAGVETANFADCEGNMLATYFQLKDRNDDTNQVNFVCRNTFGNAFMYDSSNYDPSFDMT